MEKELNELITDLGVENSDLEEEKDETVVFECPICDAELEEDVDECPECGTVFVEG